MVPTAAILTTGVLFGLLFWGMDALLFLRPYRNDLLVRHGAFLSVFLGLLTVNVFAGFLQVGRKLGLRRAGQRLHHLQREGALADELARQIES